MKKKLLQKTLSKKLIDRIILIDKTDLYNGYCTQLHRVADRLEEKDSLFRPFVRRPRASNYKTPADSIDWKPSTGRVTAAANDVVERKKLYTKWIMEKKLVRKRKEKLCFRCSGSGYRARNYSYLPVKRPTALAKADNKKKAIKIIVANDKKTARPQVEEVSNLKPVSVFNLENE